MQATRDSLPHLVHVTDDAHHSSTVAKLVHFNRQPVSIFGGVRYWAVSPEDAGPTGWGARFGLTFLFPKK